MRPLILSLYKNIVRLFLINGALRQTLSQMLYYLSNRATSPRAQGLP